MALIRTDKLPVASDADVVAVRQRVRALALEAGFSLVDQTKIVTAASELARNTVVHGGGGTAELELVVDSGRRGVRLTFRDHGPGIPDIETAMRDGFTSGNGLGLGLGGARRLSNEFEIDSRPGAGTVVRIARWR
jgi:serine/threonine-protein kinase RsbT